MRGRLFLKRDCGGLLKGIKRCCWQRRKKVKAFAGKLIGPPSPEGERRALI